jgi:hypothetical protein
MQEPPDEIDFVIYNYKRAAYKEKPIEENRPRNKHSYARNKTIYKYDVQTSKQVHGSRREEETEAEWANNYKLPNRVNTKSAK